MIRMCARSMVAFSLAAVTSVSMAPVYAQVPGEVLKKPVGTMDQARYYRRVVMLGAQCLLDERPSNVRNFLTMFPDGKDAARSAAYLNQGDCVDGQAGSQAVRFGPSMLRGTLYKAMYVRAYRDRAPTLGMAIDYAADAVGQPDATAKPYVASRKLAECIVRRDPEHARAAVLAEVESEEEMAALRALMASWDRCYQADAPQMTRAALAGVLAETLYRLSKPERGKNA